MTHEAMQEEIALLRGDVARLKPMNDVLFKFIFGREEHKHLTIDFLNAVLNLPENKLIRDISFINTEIPPSFQDDKLTRMDILATAQDGRVINVEVQVIDYSQMDKRTLFYWSTIFTTGIKKGEDYRELPPVVTINILGYNYLDIAKFPDFHSRYVLYNPETQHQLTDVLEIHFVEIQKLAQKPLRERTKLERWLLFLNNKLTETERKELVTMDTQINEAYGLAENFSLKDAEMYQYINRQMAIMDYNANLRSSRQEGIAEGIGIGRAEGIGIGAERRNREVALTMLGLNQPYSLISQVTGYTESQIKEIGAKL